MDRPGGDSTRQDGRDARVPDAARIPDELVDAFFDRELDVESQREMFGRLRGDMPRCEEIARTREMLSELRREARGPDLTEAILSRVERRRGFMTPKWQRVVTTGRLAVAAGVLLGIGLAATAQRLWPEATSLREQPAPLSGFVESTRADASSSFRALERTLGAAPREIAGRLGDELTGAPFLPMHADDHARAMYLSSAPSWDDGVSVSIDMAAATRYFACSSSLWPTGACDFRAASPAVVAERAPGSSSGLLIRTPGRSTLIASLGDLPEVGAWMDLEPSSSAATPSWLVEARSATFEPRAILRGSSGLRVLELHVADGAVPGHPVGRPVLVTRWSPPSAAASRGPQAMPSPASSRPVDDLP